MSDKDEDQVVLSMVDVMNEEQELEDDAVAVLGASDAKNCTYPQGYLDRQALYSCKTCVVKDGQLAGVCLACSLDCHNGHELFELYTKRNFRCDCGNGKFENFTCKLFPYKDKINNQNKYNQNFHGLYCTCARPYPDPDDDVEDEMIQCIICEDWYHGRHLGSSYPPESGEYAEMICPECMKNHGFLWKYCVLSVAVKLEKSEDDEKTIDVECSNSEYSLTSEKNETDNDKPVDSKTDTLSSIPTSPCHLLELSKRKGESHSGATFWHEGWRKKLCRCTDCQQMYENQSIGYLLDERDSLVAYERKGKDTAASHDDKVMAALSSIDRVQQVEMLQGYADLKDQLKEYLKSFAESGKVVTESDIAHFFEEMQSRKRRKLDSGIPHYCR